MLQPPLTERLFSSLLMVRVVVDNDEVSCPLTTHRTGVTVSFVPVQ